MPYTPRGYTRMRNGKLTKKPPAQKRKVTKAKGRKRQQKGSGLGAVAMTAGKFLAPVILGQLLSNGLGALTKKKKGSGHRRKKQHAGGLMLLGRK